MKNRKVLILSIIFIFIMGGAVVGYNYLKNNYNIDLEEENIDKIKSPDFKVYDINDKEVNLSDYKGKNLVINFWASWCPPCKYEMPYFQNATNKYKNKNIEILMLNLTDGERETVDSAKKYMKENNFDMNLLFDKDFNGAKAYQVQGIPRTIFIDEEGYIIKDHTGAIEQDILYDNIDKLIK